MPTPGLLERAASCLQQGRLEDAEQLLAQAERTLSRSADWYHLAGILQLQRHKPAEALPLFEQALRLAPQHAHVWNNRGIALTQLRQPSEAEACHRRASELAPGHAAFVRNQAECLQRLGRHGEAIALLRPLVSRTQATAKDRFVLAISLGATGQHAEAQSVYRNILDSEPTYWQAAVNYAALRQHDRASPAEIEQIYRTALAHSPTAPILLYNLANLLAERGPLPEVERLLQQAVSLQPHFFEAWLNLGDHYHLLRRFSEAKYAARQAVQLRPQHPHAWNLLGVILREIGEETEAESCYRHSLALAPGTPETLTNLAHLLRHRGLTTEAEGHFREVIAKQPHEAEAYNGLGLLCSETGRLEEGVAFLRRAAELAPRNAKVRSNLLFMQSYLGLCPPAEARDEARRWEQCLGPVARLPTRKPRRERLRIGYLSPDFRRHAVAYFIEPVLAAHDTNQVEVFCFAHVPRPDSTTQRIQATGVRWCPIHSLNDDEAAAVIRQHEIDVLVDLAGHTRNTRLAVFARKPAPIQASWLGYFATTGLSAMDYWITDTVLHPSPTTDGASEQLWRLPRCYVSYQAPREAPDPVCRTEPGQIVFGSFNNFAKLSRTTFHLWAEVLRAVPDSRFYLKTAKLNDPETRARLTRAFAEESIAADRLILAGNTAQMQDHLACYSGMDIALDSFPFTGATTTADTTWMGVPVVSLAGKTFASRMSATMLTAAGCADQVVHSPEAFVAKAVALADRMRPLSVAERTAHRQQQRATMATSELCDSRGMARALEAAYAGMVQRCLAG